MTFNIFGICVFALFQTITGQCLGNPFSSGLGLANNLASNSLFGNGLASNSLVGNGLADNDKLSSSLAGNGINGNRLAGNDFGNRLAGNGIIGNRLAGNGVGNGIIGSSLASGLGCNGFGCGAGVASTGGGLSITSASPAAPKGVSVVSKNVYEGNLAAGGNFPFLGTVGVEGPLPTAGAGAVSYGCGDGSVSIGKEAPIATGIAVPVAVFPPGSPTPAATNAALGLVGNVLSYNSNGFGYNGNGLANNGNGLGYNGNGGHGLSSVNGINFYGINGLKMFNSKFGAPGA